MKERNTNWIASTGIIFWFAGAVLFIIPVVRLFTTPQESDCIVALCGFGLLIIGGILADVNNIKW